MQALGIITSTRTPGWNCEPFGENLWHCTPPHPQIAALAFQDYEEWKYRYPHEPEPEQRHFWLEAEQKIVIAKKKELGL